MTTIITKNSSTAGAAPLAADLVQGELAVNVTSKALYTKNASAAVVKLNTPSIVDNGDATAITIDSSENVGIGTSSPNAKLTVDGGNAAIKTGNKFYLWNTSNDNAPYLKHVNGGIGFFNTSDSQAMQTDSSGNLLVGTTSPTLGALGNFVKSNSTNYMMYVENTANTSGDKSYRSVLGANCNNTSSFHFVANTGGNDRLYIYGNGNVVNSNNSYGALSDVKLKENITDAAPKLSGLMQVRVVNYNLKSDPEYKQLGVIAQELEQVFPGLVDETPDYQDVVRTREVDVPAVLDEEGNEVTAATTTTEEYTERELTGSTTKSVKYSVFVPMLIKAMQEQQAIITTQQATLTTLTERITALEAK